MWRRMTALAVDEALSVLEQLHFLVGETYLCWVWKLITRHS